MDYRYEMFQKESTSVTIHKKSGLGGLVLIGKPGPDLFFKVCEYRVAGGEVLTCAF